MGTEVVSSSPAVKRSSSPVNSASPHTLCLISRRRCPPTFFTEMVSTSSTCQPTAQSRTMSAGWPDVHEQQHFCTEELRCWHDRFVTEGAPTLHSLQIAMQGPQFCLSYCARRRCNSL